MADLTTGKLPKALGPTTIGDSVFSEASGAGSIAGLLHIFGDLTLHGSTSGTLALRPPAVAGTSVVTFPVGTTDFTATGGAGQVLQQATLGGPITVGAVPAGSIGGLGAGVAAWLAVPSSANLAAAVTGETGTGALVFATSPALVTPNLGAATGTSLVATGLLQAGTTLGIDGDVLLNRHAANVLALRNGAAPQGLRTYNTYTDASNGEWTYLGSWSSNVARYGTDLNGTGVARDVSIVRGGTEVLRFAATTISTVQALGIGAVPPAGTLYIQGANTAAYAANTIATGVREYIANSDLTASNMSRLVFAGSDTGGTVRNAVGLTAVLTHNATSVDGELAIQTAVAGVAAERLRIGSTGATFTAAIIQKPAASVIPANNGELTVEATSNTQLTFRFKGSDGTVRANTLTLA